MRVLAADVGGTHVKVLATGRTTPRELASGPTLTAGRMVAGIKTVAAGWTYDAVTVANAFLGAADCGSKRRRTG